MYRIISGSRRPVFGKFGRAVASFHHHNHHSSIRKYLHILLSGDCDMREEALQRLIEFGAQAVPPLIDALQDDRGEVRFHAAVALGHIGDQRASAPLMLALRSGDARSRTGAAFALGELGDLCGVPLLIAALHDENDAVRRQAVTALGKLKHEEAISPLIATFQYAHRDPELSARVVEALVGMGEGAVQPLLAILNYENIETVKTVESVESVGNVAVRTGAVSALSLLGDRRAVPVLIAILKRQGECNSVLRQTVAALGDLGDPVAVPSLITTFQDTRRPWEVRCFAAISLGKLKDRDAVRPLIAALDQEPDNEVLCYAVRALGQLRDERAVSPLIALLANKGTNWYNNFNNYDNGGEQASVGELNWRTVSLLCSVADALGLLGDPRSIEPLSSLFTTPGCPRELSNRVALALASLEKRGYTSALLPTDIEPQHQGYVRDDGHERDNQRENQRDNQRDKDRSRTIDPAFGVVGSAMAHQNRAGIRSDVGARLVARTYRDLGANGNIGQGHERWHGIGHRNDE